MVKFRAVDQMMGGAGRTYEEALDDYLRAKSPFREGKRLVINIVPIVINTFAPWILFSVILFALTAQVHHRHPRAVETLCVVLAAVVIGGLSAIVMRTRASYVPSWYKVCLILMVAAFISAEAFGWYNYIKRMRPFYEWEQLQSYPHVDVSQVSGRHLQDAGRVYFSAGTHINAAKSWHFKHAGVLYCVAPLENGGAATNHDFWVVGKNCCSETAADFRCGEYANPQARAGLRVLDDPALPERHFYQLAVKGAVAIFHNPFPPDHPLEADSPVFFYWVQDPLHQMQSMRDAGWDNLIIANIYFMAGNVLSIVLCTCRFAFIGREATPLLEDDDLYA